MILKLILYTFLIKDCYSYENTIYLPTVNSLTFNKHEFTTYRRTYPIPKLICQSNLQYDYDKYCPSVVRCYNTGFDDTGNISWECNAELEDLFKIGKCVVSCEGYNNSSDPWILSGSCGLKYDLELTHKGKSYFDKIKQHNVNNVKNVNVNKNTIPQIIRTETITRNDNNIFSYMLFFIISFIGIYSIVLISTYKNNYKTTNTQTPTPNVDQNYNNHFHNHFHYNGASNQSRPSSVPPYETSNYYNSYFNNDRNDRNSRFGFNLLKRNPIQPSVTIINPVFIPPKPIIRQRIIPSPPTPIVTTPNDSISCGTEVKSVKAYATTKNR